MFSAISSSEFPLKPTTTRKAFWRSTAPMIRVSLLICPKVLLTAEMGKVIINNLTDERSLSIPAHDSQISCMRFNFKGNYFATASKKVRKGPRRVD